MVTETGAGEAIPLDQIEAHVRRLNTGAMGDFLKVVGAGSVSSGRGAGRGGQLG